MRAVATCILFLAAAAFADPAGSLFVNANPGTNYGGRTFPDVVWGDGYPTVTAQFLADSNIVFNAEHGGGPAQRTANNGLRPNTVETNYPNNDNPDFISVYTNTLRLNALIADTGTVSMVYTFASPMTLVDLIVCDVDDEDSAVISATDADGNPLAPSNFVFVAEGDLSLALNAGSRDPLEPATPPAWNPVTGTLTAQVQWNENRSYTVLRIEEGTQVRSITVTFTGARHDKDGPAGASLGSHIYVNLWATPRGARLERDTSISDYPAWQVPSLPGVVRTIQKSEDLISWEFAGAVTGPPPPVAHATWADTSAASRLFFRIAP